MAEEKIDGALASSITLSNTTGRDSDTFELDNKTYNNGEEVYLYKTTITRNVAKISSSIEWKDQGFGNQKGQLFLILSRDGRAVKKHLLFGIAPHELTSKQIESVEEDMEFSAQKYDRVVLQAIVGGGGGHSLYFKSFRFTIHYEAEQGEPAEDEDVEEEVAAGGTTGDQAKLLQIDADYEYGCRSVKMDCEFFMGLQNMDDSKRKTDNSELKEMYIAQKPAKKLAFNFERGLVRGLQFDNIKCGSFSNSEAVLIGDENETGDYLMFSKIVVQFNIHQASDAPNLHWIGWNYICLYGGGGGGDPNQKYEIGVLQDKGLRREETQGGGQARTVNVYYEKVATATGNLFIKGVAMHNKNLVGLQVVHVANYGRAQDLMCCFGNVDEDDVQGLVQGIKQKNYYAEILRYKIINFQHSDVLTGMRYLTNRVSQWDAGSTAIHRALPKFLQFINQGLEGDVDVLQSVFCINRFLSFVNKKSYAYVEYEPWFRKDGGFGANGGLTRDKFETVCGIWQLLNNACGTVAQINYYKPQFTIYAVTFFKPSWFNAFASTLTFITQLCLFCIVASSIDYGGVDVLDVAPLSVIVSILISAVVFVLSRKQIKDHFDFVNTFTAGKSHTNVWLLLSFMINVCLSVLIVPLNFAILMLTHDRFELVLNGIAVLFILELDEGAVDVSEPERFAIFSSFIRKNLYQSMQQFVQQRAQ